MSLHRGMLFALALLFTGGMTSVASAGCGGCGTPTAAIVYAAPVAPAPRIAWQTWGWGTGCGCHRAFVYAATPTVTLTPIAAAPIYVVDQGPDYSGPGITIPYHLWTTGSYIVPGTYPYYWHRHRYGYGHWYWHHRHFFAPRRYVWYHRHFYGHHSYHRPWWGMHHHWYR